MPIHTCVKLRSVLEAIKLEGVENRAGDPVLGSPARVLMPWRRNYLDFLPSLSCTFPTAFCTLPLICWLVSPLAAPATSLDLPLTCLTFPASRSSIPIEPPVVWVGRDHYK